MEYIEEQNLEQQDVNKCEDYYQNLNSIRDNIEKMNKFNQIEILKIFLKYKNITINENKYGVHINLSEVDSDIISELSKFVSYVNVQESYLNDIEKQKEAYKTTFFNSKTT